MNKADSTNVSIITGPRFIMTMEALLLEQSSVEDLFLISASAKLIGARNLQ